MYIPTEALISIKPDVRKAFYPQTGTVIWRVRVGTKIFWRFAWRDAIAVLHSAIGMYRKIA